MFVTLRKAVGVCLPSDSRPAMCRGIPELQGEGVCVCVLWGEAGLLSRIWEKCKTVLQGVSAEGRGCVGAGWCGSCWGPHCCGHRFWSSQKAPVSIRLGTAVGLLGKQRVGSLVVVGNVGLRQPRVRV